MTDRPSSGRRSLLVRVALTVALAVAVAPIAAPLAAQDAAGADERAAPEFRVGQWGAQFNAGDGLYGVGVLRFRSPNTAWTLDGTANVDVRSTAPEVGASADNSNASITARVGLRRYHAARGPIRAFHGAGLTGGVGRTNAETQGLFGTGLSKRTTSSFQLGAFGELGASYFVTSHLALGARGLAAVGYLRGSSESESSSAALTEKQTENGAFLQLGSVQFQVTLFF